MNTQLIPPSAPLLANLPSGRDIHTPPAPFTPPSLDEDQLLRMRAPPDESQYFRFASDPDDSEDNGDPVSTPGPPGGFPDRSQTASNVYY